MNIVRSLFKAVHWKNKLKIENVLKNVNKVEITRKTLHKMYTDLITSASASNNYVTIHKQLCRKNKGKNDGPRKQKKYCDWV